MREKWCVVMVGGGVVGILGRAIETARQTTCTFRKNDRSPPPLPSPIPSPPPPPATRAHLPPYGQNIFLMNKSL